MLPNFESDAVLSRLAALAGPNTWLLFSANLAPGPDYIAGVQRILPLYDNPLTREWLLTFLLDLGVERADGALQFTVEEQPPGSGLRRVAAYFEFSRPRVIQIETERFPFRPGESIRLFFSYRHTPELARRLLSAHGLEVREQWVAKSEEEGVFLAGRKAETPPRRFPNRRGLAMVDRSVLPNA